MIKTLHCTNGYSSDPQTSFLAARYLAQILQFNEFQAGFPSEVFQLVGHYIDEVSKGPQNIEWSNLNMCYTNPNHRLERFGDVTESTNAQIVTNIMIQ